MRHSRRAVMAERYKLYAKKNILNSRYLVRNLQIGLLVFVLVAMLVGSVVLMNTAPKEEVVVAQTKTSVKDALFGNSEESKVATEQATEQETTATEATESVIAEKVQTELDNTITEVANSVAPVEEVQSVEEPEGEFANKCIANVEETLNIRKDPSAEAEFVGQMNNGAIAIVQGTEGEWTKIKSGDVEGYVLTEYVLTGTSAEEFAKDYVTLRGTVLEDGVNIRSEKSTDAGILAVMDKDDTITVLESSDKEEVTEDEIVVGVTPEGETLVATTVTTEAASTEVTTEATTTEVTAEATTTVTTEQATSNLGQEQVTTTAEEIEWVSVMLEDGQTGYVSAEFIEIDELYEIAVSAEELQRRAEEEAARKAAEEEAARLAAEAAAKAAQEKQKSSETYKGATTKPVTATQSGEYIGTFTITAYCGCKKCSGGHNKTASGTTPTEGRTIAADTSILPFGTQVVIDGIVYTVEDRGSGVSGNHIDIFFATHAKAMAFGRKTMKVYKY